MDPRPPLNPTCLDFSVSSNTYPTVYSQVSVSPLFSPSPLCPTYHWPFPNPLSINPPTTATILSPTSLTSKLVEFESDHRISHNTQETKMMIHQAMNQNSNNAKTAEIMSRYRPIAPKPDLVLTNSMSDGSLESQKIRQSPYLRNNWAVRPTRTRKRGRTSLGPPPIKRHRTVQIFELSSPCHITAPQNMSIHGFDHGPEAQTFSTLVTLPLLPFPIMDQTQETESGNCVIDLNRLAELPEERDFLQLQSPISPSVISPQPIRPVGSSISVGSINTDHKDASSSPTVQVPKKREEVESEVESEELPAVVSDSNNKVRLANSAYKEMVGQPECPWLDSMVTLSSCKRICGEVMLQFSDITNVPVKSNGFSCWVKIEWGSNGKGSSVHAFCDVMRLSCESKDYIFAWRFHTREASESDSKA